MKRETPRLAYNKNRSHLRERVVLIQLRTEIKLEQSPQAIVRASQQTFKCTYLPAAFKSQTNNPLFSLKIYYRSNNRFLSLPVLLSKTQLKTTEEMNHQTCHSIPARPKLWRVETLVLEQVWVQEMWVKKLQSKKLSKKKHTMTVESHLTARLFAIKLIL